jgi:hypothetical protein
MLSSPHEVITNSDYELFTRELMKKKITPSFKVFKDKSLVNEVTKLGEKLFGNIIFNIKCCLENPNTGIGFVDVPQNKQIKPQEDAFFGAAAALSISWNLADPSLDIINSTPFTIHTASQSNADKLAAARVKQNTPEAKLGFHNDGRIDDDNILVPNTIALYNILIAYNNPGYFYWVPFAVWPELNKFSDIFGVNKLYTFDIVPSAYAVGSDQLDIHGQNEITAPLFSKNQDGSTLMFLNGDIKSDGEGNPVDADIIKSLQTSISTNQKKFAIKQQARRLILLANALGCHARDIFEQPIEGTQLTRVHIRSVDLNGIQL